ncbi:aspartate carbamoyltransferase catalytic subunit [Caminibacter mediatlanticus]|uniref:Aspartate carbamoyltransferase n=1 Tax=Caminibacter mediatlanticus TB-2 TaxID=391592 RepID=A0AAI9F367_9BACT|nr:aspartate carbamoyltransferase catalytic subunit [Caminibacter mediatlanticus]EDM24485.1 aspartate carbamoyltransferase catalytic subunit [Caminibacter mediatlanticus TB-2]
MSKHLTHTKDLSKNEIVTIFKYAKEFLDEKKRDDLRGKLIINIFFENSTRTRSSFEIAAKRLSADVVNLDVNRSSTAKGETLFDTAANLDAMGPDAIIVRHNRSGVPKILSKYVKCSIINAGDGAHQHPTQGLLDLFTLLQKFKTLEGKTIAIVGDIRNSRVANSDIELFTRFGANVILVGPPQFLPKTTLPTTYNLKEAINHSDAIISLRTQTERHKTPTFASLKDYAENFKITKEVIKDKDILIMHPGPVHRNIDIDDEVLEDERCLVLNQVKNGVAVRMGILKFLIEN